MNKMKWLKAFPFFCAMIIILLKAFDVFSDTAMAIISFVLLALALITFVWVRWQTPADEKSKKQGLVLVVCLTLCLALTVYLYNNG